MKKSIRIIIPIVLLLLFITIMTTGAFLKKPMASDDDFIQFLEDVELEVMNENWDQAREHLTKTKKAWSKIANRIQFSTERGEITKVHTSLERIEGYLRAKDKGGAMADLSEARHIWDEIGK